MEHRFNRTQIFTRHDVGEELLFIHVIRDVQIREIHEFGAIFQIIHHQDIGMTAIVERFHNVAANHARAAGYDNHMLCL